VPYGNMQMAWRGAADAAAPRRGDVRARFMAARAAAIKRAPKMRREDAAYPCH